MEWERINEENEDSWGEYRSPVLGGWIFRRGAMGVTFIPDPNHEWKIERKTKND
jgi:hypothetical protein